MRSFLGQILRLSGNLGRLSAWKRKESFFFFFFFKSGPGLQMGVQQKEMPVKASESLKMSVN